ncbi:hypothetical protein [Epibacterium ulvae]|nr:hypothetical protein [Epibacterium ulvae]
MNFSSKVQINVGETVTATLDVMEFDLACLWYLSTIIRWPEDPL